MLTLTARKAAAFTARLSGARAASTITAIKGRQIIDSRGNPTVEVDLFTKDGKFTASVPSGASTGIYEAMELRDGGKAFMGKGVTKAVGNVNTAIAKCLAGQDVTKQATLDKMMIELDGSENKSKLGANAILGVSLAAAKAGAAAKKVPLYKHFGDLAGNSNFVLPVPSFNVINGGSHAGNKLAFQEFMILPTGASTFSEAMAIGCEVYHHLAKVIKAKYGQDAVNVGDEGGFAPNIQSNTEGVELLMSAIDKAGYLDKVKIGMDVASSEFLTKDGKYDLDFKNPQGDGKQVLSGPELAEMYIQLSNKYPIVSIEDPFDQVRKKWREIFFIYMETAEGCLDWIRGMKGRWEGKRKGGREGGTGLCSCCLEAHIICFSSHSPLPFCYSRLISSFPYSHLAPLLPSLRMIGPTTRPSPPPSGARSRWWATTSSSPTLSASRRRHRRRLATRCCLRLIRLAPYRSPSRP